MKILVTGSAGFIGFFTAKALLEKGHTVIGIDNINDYYDPSLKEARLAQLTHNRSFQFQKIDISDKDAIDALINQNPDISIIIHLAAQAGVRYSIENPHTYAQSNLIGHLNMLEAARALKEKGLKHFVYASSSSVYGGNKKIPFSVEDDFRMPVSFYAATKASNELMSQCYAHLYKFPATGLRFFTVYGPWGRPDMALFSFTKSIIEGKPITVFNHGDMKRDFTYIDDIVNGIIGVMDTPPTNDDKKYCPSDAPHRVFNLGNNEAEHLMDFIATIENALGMEADKKLEPMAPGDVKETFANIDASTDVFGYKPTTPISVGIPKFIEWYKGYYNAQ